MKKTRTPHLTMEEARAQRKWWLVDAEGVVLGRLATALARILMGKHKPIWSPHTLCGDFVVVINAEKVCITGKKFKQKEYRWYTGYPGGLKSRTFEQMQQRAPEKIIRLAVRRMLPKNRLGRRMLKMLKVYKGIEHPHTAQQPQAVDPFLLAYGRAMEAKAHG